MPIRETNPGCDPALLALRALAWTLGEDARADRLLALTGLDPRSLRARADDPALLAATLRFLAANEADLVACAAALDVAPAVLAAAADRLEAA
jgi:hypothetical protein